MEFVLLALAVVGLAVFAYSRVKSAKTKAALQTAAQAVSSKVEAEVSSTVKSATAATVAAVEKKL